MQEDPPRGDVRNDVLQGESDGSQLSDNKHATQKPEMISGVFLGIIFVVITFNLDLNSVCQKKGHSCKAVDRFFSVLTMWNERPQNDYMWSTEKEIHKSAGNIQARLCLASCLVKYVEKAINKMKNGTGRLKNRSSTMLEC